MKTTPLYEFHDKMGAKFVEFNGWHMPVWFEGPKEEHLCVRESLGIFDVSHMGEIEISGTDSEVFVDYIFTNSILNLSDGQARYGFICNQSGGVVDDVIIYKMLNGAYFICVNAGNVSKVFNWLLENSNTYNVEIKNLSDFYGQLAIQGPNSIDFMDELFPLSEIKSIKKYRIASILELEESYADNLKWKCPNGNNFLIARTGYTGEEGFELFVPNEMIKDVYKTLIENKNLTPIPCGLGSRDTLRIEMGFPLYGNELSEEISPIDSDLEKFIDMTKKDFIGKDSIAEKIQEKEFTLIGLEMNDKAIPRHGYKIFNENKIIGHVTSGTFSPILKRGICLGLIENKFSNLNEFQVEIRKKYEDAHKVTYPFIK